MPNTSLSRTLTSGSATNKYTYSTWIKYTKYNTAGTRFFSTTGTGDTYFRFNADGTMEVSGHNSSGSSGGYFITNRKFIDHSAWYHFVIRFDSTEASASNRLRFYVNGVQEESFSSYYDVNSGATDNINLSGNTQYIGSTAGGQHFDGIMSHINYSDGYSYGPTEFGETDTLTGEWKIKASPAITYGTNGFFMLKDGNSLLDQSGNSNNFTLATGTLSKTEDCPSNVFSTLNPLQRNATTANNNTLSHGNNRQAPMSSGSYTPQPSALGVSSGKFYVEMKVTTLAANCFIGIDGDATSSVRLGRNLGYSPNGYCYAQWGGKYHNGTSVASAGDTFTTGDIVGVALDCDNNKLYFSKNGVWQASGDPTSGSTGTGAFYTIASADSTADGAYFFEASNNDTTSGSVWDWNFGNGYFGSTAVASAGTNASGNGIFEYDVPTGYTALSTKGLNL
tara:strand:- start:1059 stop:2408 length:1350 start_codon:yes stop_codon:yes gene_type:complete